MAGYDVVKRYIRYPGQHKAVNFIKRHFLQRLVAVLVDVIYYICHNATSNLIIFIYLHLLHNTFILIHSFTKIKVLFLKNKLKL